MADYQHTVDLNDGAGGYVKYNISADSLALRDILKIDGVICSNAYNITKINIYFGFDFTGISTNVDLPSVLWVVPFTYDLKIDSKKGKETAFSYEKSVISFWRFDRRDEPFDIFTEFKRGNKFRLQLDYFYGTSGSCNTIELQLITNLVYHINPQLLAFDIARCNYWGEWDFQGNYIRCKQMKFSVNPQYPTQNLGNLTLQNVVYIPNDGSATEQLGWFHIPAAAFTEAGYSDPNNYEDALFITGIVATTKSYSMEFDVADGLESVHFIAAQILPASARLHLSGATNGGVGIGMFSTATNDQPKFEVAQSHQSIFYGPVEFRGEIQGIGDYTSGEVATGGHWIDGKPIYRYVAYFTSKTGGPTISGINEMISMYGAVKNNGNSRWMPLPMTSTAVSNQVQIYVESNGKITIETDNKNFTTGPYIVIVEYTKK